MTQVFLDGRNIFLSPMSGEEKLEGYVQWINEQETTFLMGSVRFPANKEDMWDYIESYNCSKDGMILGIFPKNTPKKLIKGQDSA